MISKNLSALTRILNSDLCVNRPARYSHETIMNAYYIIGTCSIAHYIHCACSDPMASPRGAARSCCSNYNIQIRPALCSPSVMELCDRRKSSKRPRLNRFLAKTSRMEYRYRNRKLEISRAPTKAKSREPAYSQALYQNKIDRQRVKIRRVRQADSQTAKVDDV